MCPPFNKKFFFPFLNTFIYFLSFYSLSLCGRREEKKKQNMEGRRMEFFLYNYIKKKTKEKEEQV
jgi:hypothetical protein